MSITKKDVEHAATLARLALSEQEVELYAAQMGKIITHIEKLGALDTTGIEPTAYTAAATGMLRKDEARPSLNQDDALRNSPEKAKGCFKVPRIIE